MRPQFLTVAALSKIKHGREKTMDRWSILQTGAILWDVANDPAPLHKDHIEMSGQRCSAFIEYGIDEKRNLQLEQTLIFPGLRTIPNNTHGSLRWCCSRELLNCLEIDHIPIGGEQIVQIEFDGVLSIRGVKNDLMIIRQLLPSREHQYAIEQFTLFNQGDVPMNLSWNEATLEYVKGCQGIYIMRRVIQGQLGLLLPGETRCITTYFTAHKANEIERLLPGEQELQIRRSFVEQLQNNLELRTPDPILNNAFALAKLRAAESVFQTKGGLMHCPGGLSYYAAVWANDQVEYAGPFFPYLGDPNSIAASKNAYELYVPFMSDAYIPIPSSIIAEGSDIWEGAGDRGDAAMYAYGASRFVLALGDQHYARKLLPAIEWCLEYCRRKMTTAGVIASDTDELENRFSSGNANLSTSCLTYGALRTAAVLERNLGKTELADEYAKRADLLACNIDSWFGATVEGFATYRYHEGSERLRAWICLPLVFGLEQRKEQTIEALYSPKLWTDDGLATESGDTVFWDRATLYALRGVLSAGDIERAVEYLKKYSRRRTLGEHVPYPVEAWPEGNQKHLSAESALYCRVFTEGLFGMEPLGFHSFRLTPKLPKSWDEMELRNIHAHGHVFDLKVNRADNGFEVSVEMNGGTKRYCLGEGETVFIDLAGKGQP